MARNFNGSTDKLVKGSAIITAAPISMSCWFNADNDSTTGIPLATANTGNNTQRWSVQLRGNVAGDPISMVNTGNNSTQAIATTSTGFTPGTWHHALGVAAATNSHAIYIDGGSKGTSTTDIGGLTPNVVSIGNLERQTPGNFFPGRIAECAIWNVALTDDDASILAKGYSPLCVKLANLLIYIPLFGRYSPEFSITKAGDTFTVTGTTTAAHSRIIYPG